MVKQKQILLPMIQHLETEFLLEKARRSAGEQIEFIITHNFQYLKERFLGFEVENKVLSVKANRVMFEYCQQVENLIIFEPQIREKISKKMYKILTGTTELLKNYCLYSQNLDSFKKEKKKMIKQTLKEKMKEEKEKLVDQYSDLDKIYNKCPMCGDRFASKKKLKKHKEDEHSND